MFEKIKKIIAKNKEVEKNKYLTIANNSLIIAASQGSYSGIISALSQGANINYSNNTNALFSVISSGSIDCLKLVLESKVDLTFKADASLSAFQFALASSANINMLNCLLDYTFNHNVADIDGNTNAHYASNNLELIQKIVSRGGRLDIRNNEGRTPFNYQFLMLNLQSRKELCEFYVQQNCDIFENNNDQQSPFILGLMSEKIENKKTMIDYFCSLLNNQEYLEKALEQIKSLRESDNKSYVMKKLESISLNVNLEKKLIVKSNIEKKIKI